LKHYFYNLQIINKKKRKKEHNVPSLQAPSTSPVFLQFLVWYTCWHGYSWTAWTVEKTP